jgi:hypothetical protein
MHKSGCSTTNGSTQSRPQVAALREQQLMSNEQQQQSAGSSQPAAINSKD